MNLTKKQTRAGRRRDADGLDEDQLQLRHLLHAERAPYNGRAPIDTAELAALGVLEELSTRQYLGDTLRRVPTDVREEIVVSLAGIIRIVHATKMIPSETSKKGPTKPRGNKRKILEWCESGPRLELQISASGLYNALQELRTEGMVRRIDHPTVKDAAGYPVDAYEITEVGKAALRL